MDVTVAIGTYGPDEAWQTLARNRAIPSAEALDAPWVHAHRDTLHDARNDALAMVDTEWVCHLDADDELEPGYFSAMAAATADVRGPAVRYVYEGGYGNQTIMATPHARMPQVAGHFHQCAAACLTAGNWLVVGSVVRTGMVRAVGGWRDFVWSEDWDLWLRCRVLAGATFEPVPAAVYRAFVRPDSRNRGQTQAARNAAHHAIAVANGLEPA